MKPPSVFALALYCASSCAVADGTAAPALPVANIAGIGGQALLVQGAHVAPATNGAALYPGDRLMTLEDAQVLVAFADGCHRRLDPDSLLTIGEQPDCGGGAGVVSFRQAIGEAGGTKKDDDDKAAVVVDAGNANTTVTSLTPGQRWAVAAALLIPALYYWDRNRDDDDDRPPVSR